MIVPDRNVILDTNVISEPFNPRADPRVVSWLDNQLRETLFITATNLAELLFGIEILASGKRKKIMAEAMQELLTRLFEDRFLAFDRDAAIAYSILVSRARTKGHSITVADGQIAAIAAVRGFAVATRDATPFLAAGVQVINPWET